MAVGLTMALTGCDDPAPAPAPSPGACPDVSGRAGTVHRAPILSADEVWRAVDGPHIVPQTIAVRAGATLTVEPCVEVRLGAGASLEAGEEASGDASRIVLDGRADAPIVITRAEPDEAWGSLAAFAPAALSLEHVALRGGGAAGAGRGAALVGVGREVTPLERPLHVREVTIADADGPDLRLEAAAAFSADSDELTITGAGHGAPAFAAIVTLHGLGSLPRGVYTGNARDVILVRPDAPNALDGLQLDTVVRDAGVPYQIGEQPGADLRLGANGGPAVTLTLQAGVELRFQPEAFLRVVADDDRAVGRLVIEGSATAPVRLTSAAAAPAPGDWAGLYFVAPEGSPMADHQVAHAAIEYAGGYCACTLASCSPIASSEAAVIFDGRPARVFMAASRIAHSAGHGVLRSWVDDTGLDFAATNTIEDVAGCPQTMPVLDEAGVSCPDAAYACDPR